MPLSTLRTAVSQDATVSNTLTRRKFVDHAASWSYPVEDDGWYHTHHAIRLDVADFLRCLGALRQRLNDQGARAFSSWHREVIARWWQRFRRSVSEHHQHEDEFMFPFLQTRCTLPRDITDDHEELDVAMSACDRAVANLTSAPLAGGSTSHSALLRRVRRLHTRFQEFAEGLEAHMFDEELICVALLRKYFKQNEAHEVVSKMKRSAMTPEDMAWVLRPMTHQKRLEFAKRECIPSLMMRMVFLPACKRYEREFTRPLEMVILGQHPPHLHSAAQSLLPRRRSALSRVLCALRRAGGAPRSASSVHDVGLHDQHDQQADQLPGASNKEQERNQVTGALGRQAGTPPSSLAYYCYAEHKSSNGSLVGSSVAAEARVNDDRLTAKYP